jgi:hypothetical protein
MSEYKGEGSPFSTIDPTIKEFREQFEQAAKEVSSDGVSVDSHSGVPSSVRVWCINSDRYFNVVGIAIDYMGGCGCPASISIEIEEEL